MRRYNNPYSMNNYSNRPRELGKGLFFFFIFALWPMWGMMALSILGNILK